jgi:large subunit ribosomal protein L25
VSGAGAPCDEEKTVPEVKLTAEPRSEFGKGAARRLRRDHKVPAVLYGHGAQPVHVALPGHATMLALKHSNTLLELQIDGKSTLALPKDVQRNPIKGFIEHVDLLVVRRGEKVTVDIPLQLVGEAANGTLVTSELTTLSIEVEATHIPQAIQYDLAGAGVGTRVSAGEIPLPAGAVLVGDPEALVIHVSSAESSMEAPAEAGEGAEGEGAAEASAEA